MRFYSLNLSPEELRLIGADPDAQRGLQLLTGMQSTLPPAPVSTPQHLLPRVEPGSYSPPPPPLEAIDLGAFDAEVNAIAVTAPAKPPSRQGVRLAAIASLAPRVLKSAWFVLHPRRLPWLLLGAGCVSLAGYLLLPVETTVGQGEVELVPQALPEPVAAPADAPAVGDDCSRAFPCDLPQ